ncbi:MAG: adenylosuccinate lyase [Spirochaetes bacterium GWF1_41_5]|nr:MAG: adenylosuccinate lyase [Spirochaetes bacterium GWF1_41_5]HBE01940.1 adenylosuccinate lyase [Spirochaetia bacterium]
MNKEYTLPFSERYASAEMLYIFSPEFKFTSWRKLWIWLAEAEKELGLPVTAAQIKQMQEKISVFNEAYIAECEKKTRHDVMAHIHAFGRECPLAEPVIHLGATSAYVGDNTDLIQMRDALLIVKTRLLDVMKLLKDFAFKYRNLPALGFTHFQPAQLTTVGKRASLWLYELLIDYHDLEHVFVSLPFRGVKGTTGTQASFLELFAGNHKKVEQLDKLVTRKAGFKTNVPVCGQTISRKFDSRIAALLSSIAQSCAKFSNDMRLLQHMKEIEEPLEKGQVGSSAMAYKRNPMRAERISSLARFVMSLEQSLAYTASTQWFERTLDDSANKRLSVPQGFLAVDSILLVFANIMQGPVVNEKIIRRNIESELPFIITENIIMAGVKKGGNRQELHEKIRVLSRQASVEIKEKGKPNNLLQLILADKSFGLTEKDLDNLMQPERYTGRAAVQTEYFIKKHIEPLLKKVKNSRVELKV